VGERVITLPNFETNLHLKENLFAKDGNISAKYTSRLHQIKKVYGQQSPVIGPEQMFKAAYATGGPSVFKQRQQSQKHFAGTNKQVYRNLIKVQSQRQWDPLLKTKPT